MNTESTSRWDSAAFKRHLRRRRAAERRFKWYGIGAVLTGVSLVLLLFVSITVSGISAFWQTQIQLDIYFDPAEINVERLQSGNYGKLVKQAMYRQFPEVTQRRKKRELSPVGEHWG